MNSSRNKQPTYAAQTFIKVLKLTYGKKNEKRERYFFYLSDWQR